MAAQLENAKIDHDDMKDLHESLTGHKWVDEKTVKICYKCERDFTIKRRKVNYTLFDQISRILDCPASGLRTSGSRTWISDNINFSITVEIVEMYSVELVLVKIWYWHQIQNLFEFAIIVIRFFLPVSQRRVFNP